jgi:hypothetical protein
MRNMDCRNVRREIEEAASGDLLSSPVNNHLANCVACGTLAREQSRLQQIVSSLGTVEAPGDFDFRLRARLAGEKAGSGRRFAPFAIGLSFGLRSAAVAAVLLLLGSALVFVSLRSDSNHSLSAKAPATGPTRVGSGEFGAVVKANAPDVSSNPNGSQVSVAVAGGSRSNASDHSPVKPRSALKQTLLASLPGKGRIVTQDSSGTRAPVLTPDNQLAGTYPTSAFPIDASYQSLKVSVDNGRGSSRTISLPTVSFGSKQSLSQNGSPLMASARQAW